MRGSYIVQALEKERNAVERKITDQQEVQRQANDCMAYKTGKQSEEQLANRIDQVDTQIGEVGLMAVGPTALAGHLLGS